MRNEYLILFALLIVVVVLQIYLITKRNIYNQNAPIHQDNFSSDTAKIHPSKESNQKNDQWFISPETMMEEERDVWLQHQTADGIGNFNPEMGRSVQDDILQYGQKAPTDYDTYLLKEAIDDETREKHNRWTNEMEPWSKNTRTRTTGLEMEDYVPWQGLRLPQPVPQKPPSMLSQLTEIDSSDLAKNKKVVWNLV